MSKSNGTPNLGHLFPFEAITPEMQDRFPLNGEGPSLSLWMKLQTLLQTIQRWAPYRETDDRIMYQDGLMHSLSQMWTYSDILEVLTDEGEAGNIDGLLMVQALTLHDLGEPLRKFEKLFYDKSWEDDVAELKLFIQELEKLGFEGKKREKRIRAFLLQFCLCKETLGQNPDLQYFPAEAQAIVQNLIQFHYKESLLFMFIENMDYWRYALCMYLTTGHKACMKSVCMSNVEILDAIVAKWPVLAKIWTPEMSAMGKKFIVDHPDVPIDAEGVPSDRA